MRILLLGFILNSFFFLYSCGVESTGEGGLPDKQTSALLKVFYGSMNSFNIGVFYEPGAEPYTQNFITGKKAWDVTEDNMRDLYDQRNQQVSFNIPKSLNEMTQISAQNKTSWTTSELLSLSNSLNFGNSSGSRAEFTIIFVNGTYQGNNNVIGISITGTTVIAIFKDVVKSLTNGETQDVKNYSEQFTIVHEVGHALGLVNNGVTLQSNHHDAAHGAHCSRSDCVMNWVNEGGKEIIDFIKNYILSGRNSAFGPQCIDDVRKFNP